MRILSITVQKPDSTGSGVFLTELVRRFGKLNCAQAVACGMAAVEDLPAFEMRLAAATGERQPRPICQTGNRWPV